MTAPSNDKHAKQSCSIQNHFWNAVVDTGVLYTRVHQYSISLICRTMTLAKEDSSFVL